MRDRTLIQTLLYLNQQLNKPAESLEITMSQYLLLHFLHEQPRRASDFAVTTNIGKPGVTAIVDQLEARGWVKRKPDPNDGRAQLISMTRKGRAAFLGFEDRMDEALRAFLGDDAINDANAALAAFYAHWNERRIARFEANRAARARSSQEAPGDAATGRGHKRGR